jgi:hypothetical protein
MRREERASRNVVGLEIATRYAETTHMLGDVPQRGRRAGRKIRVGLADADRDRELARVVPAGGLAAIGKVPDAIEITRVAVGARHHVLAPNLRPRAVDLGDVELRVAVGPLGTAARDEARPGDRPSAGHRRYDEGGEPSGPVGPAILRAGRVCHEHGGEQHTCRDFRSSNRPVEGKFVRPSDDRPPIGAMDPSHPSTAVRSGDAATRPERHARTRSSSVVASPPLVYFPASRLPV